jgi:NAD(P)-dependent dehydrogenase (short-subunit alcohol dehydrogenase family)
MSNPFDLTAKSILVTGASSGIGKQSAITLSQQGAMLTITGRNEENLNQTFAALSGSGHQKIVADLTNETELAALIANAAAFDGIVLAAGIVKVLPFRFINKAEMKSIYETNYEAPILLTQGLLKAKKIISSISGVKVGLVANSMYSGTKAALSGITKTLALEMAPQQIRVNTLAPGMVRTEMVTGGVSDAVSKEALSEDEKLYPLGYGNPEDIASTVSFLMSDAARWITGTDIIIDGGYSCK